MIRIKMKMWTTVALTAVCLLAPAAFLCSDCFAFILKDKTDDPLTTGVWVTVFSEKKVLYSKDAASTLLEFCRKKGIKDVYLQIYRSNLAYYDSRIADRSKYEDMISKAGQDMIDYLTARSQETGVRVHAWINVLSLAENRNAGILKKYGDSILTRDQHLRVSMKTQDVAASDKYYLRDTQLFLEPGDKRVVEYILAIASEIAGRYPGLAGIHLDYIRYPYAVPFVPGSRFNQFGLTYGYGQENISRFKSSTGLDPFTLEAVEEFISWDDWKRDQVTSLVQAISSAIKALKKDMVLSCAVMPSLDQAYMAAFQDWPSWLERGIVDHVVLMNYTKDDNYARAVTRAALSQRGKGKVMVGLGAFLMKEEPGRFQQQYEAVLQTKPDGIVFFSYDDISG